MKKYHAASSIICYLQFFKSSDTSKFEEKQRVGNEFKSSDLIIHGVKIGTY